jgi:hypothetical protein
MATVLVPGVKGALPQVAVSEVADPADDGYGRIRLEWGDGSRDEIYWTRRLMAPLETVDGIETDSALVHITTDGGGQLVRAMVYDGSYLFPHMLRWRDARDTFVLPEG